MVPPILMGFLVHVLPGLAPYATLISAAPDIIASIQTAVAFSNDLIRFIEKRHPDLLPALSTLGKELFPKVEQPHKAVLWAMNMRFTREVQEKLNKIYTKLPPLVVDGLYGQRTKARVAQFQIDHPPLIVDGWCGPQTWAVLNKR